MRRVLKLCCLSIMTIIVVIPLLLLVALSFGKGYEFPRVLPVELSFEGYKYLLYGHPRMLSITWRSIQLSSGVATLSVLLGLLAGKGLSGDFKGKKLIERLMLLPLLIPIVSVAMGLHIVFIKLHLANKFVGVLLMQTVVALPYAVLIFTELYKMIGEKWFEQGDLYGAIGYKRFMYVTFPLLSEGIISAFSICFIISFSQYFVTVLMGGGRIKTFATEMFPFINGGDFMISSSFSVAFLVINVMMLLIMEVFVRSFVRRGYHSIER